LGLGQFFSRRGKLIRKPGKQTGRGNRVQSLWVLENASHILLYSVIVLLNLFGAF